jgi:fructose-1,6-bisphosphatase/inositol monophosphatase family enzyme
LRAGLPASKAGPVAIPATQPTMRLTRNSPTEEELLEAGIAIVKKTIVRVLNKVAEHPEDAFDKLWYPKLSKFVLKVDLFAEREGRDYLRDRFTDRIEIRGEESSLEKVPQDRIAALMDMLDGSDLLERGLGNWCSAVVFFDSARRRVVASVVGLPSRRIYYARASHKGAYVIPPRLGERRQRITHPLRVKSNRVRLEDASLAFYGQKVRNFLSLLPPSSPFAAWLHRLAREAEEKQDTPQAPALRLYNLGGNPMMLKLAEGRIDAVLDVQGQQCHDVIPGAYIALKAGAVLKDLENADLTEETLATKLENPAAKLKYVLGSNRQLAEELVALLAIPAPHGPGNAGAGVANQESGIGIARTS